MDNDQTQRSITPTSDDHSDREALQLREAQDSLPQIHRAGTASSFTPRPWSVRLWHRHVAITVNHDACRDHWANERTALGYIRTAQAFAMLGVVIAQLMRLSNDGDPNPNFGYFVVSIPVACICHVCAIIIVLVGAFRFFHWQHEMACGYGISSGWELMTTFMLSLAVLVVLFVIILVISIERSNE